MNINQKTFALTSVLIFTLITGCSLLKQNSDKRIKFLNDSFYVKNCVVYKKNHEPVAKYQAKTYSLDGGELVEEYNLLFIGNLSNKQIIGDLIDFVSERHQGAEVEVEINSEGSPFNL